MNATDYPNQVPLETAPVVAHLQEELGHSKRYFRIHNKPLRQVASFWKILILAIPSTQNKEHHVKADFIGGVTGRTKFSWICFGKTACILEHLNHY